jgi:hypothetical protein
VAEKTIVEIMTEYLEEIRAELRVAEEMIEFYQKDAKRNRQRIENVTRARFELISGMRVDDTVTPPGVRDA